MKTFLSLFLILALSFPGLAANVRVDVHFAVDSAIVSKRRVTVTLVEPGPVALGNWVFAGDSKSVFTDASGVALFTNMLTLGSYRMDIAGVPSRSYLFCVYSTNGTYNVTELFGACTTNQVVNYYTADQIDSMLTNVAGSAIGVYGTNGIISTTNGTVVSLSLYSAPAIASFVNNQISVEQGATVSDTILDWTLSGGAITSQSLNQGIGSLAIGLRTYSDPTDYTTSRTYTLTASDGTTTPTANTTITFLNKRYWGVATNSTLTDAQILVQSSEFATSLGQTRTVQTTNSYPFFAWPASFGLVSSFKVGGFTDNGWTLTTRSFTNASNYATSYNIYVHTETLLGQWLIEVLP